MRMRAFLTGLTAAFMTGTAGAAEPAPGEWKQVYAAPKGEVGGRSYCKPVMLPGGRVFIWGAPGRKDWTTGAFDIAARKWVPLPPRGKEAWVESKPKMRFGIRWGSGTYLDKNTKRPVPVLHFNQAAYVPSLKKVLYVVGEKTMLFDLESREWEVPELKTHPPLVLWSALCYDPVNDEVVLFGGTANDDAARPGTWVFAAKTRTWSRSKQPLAKQPPPRCNAPLAYDSRNKLIAVFGGDAQDRYLSDTWVYDCAGRQWRELETNLRPFPRALPALCYLDKHGVFAMAGGIPGVPWPPGYRHRPRGKFGGEVWVLDAAKAEWRMVGTGFPGGFWYSLLYDGKRDQVLLHRGTSKYPKNDQLQFYAWKPRLEAAGKGVTHDGKPVYRYHPPEWYTQDKVGKAFGPLPPVDPQAGEKLIASLEPNKWKALKPPRNSYGRTWGTIAYDPDRQEVLNWGGGHCGYCGTDIGHFSLKTLRWQTSFAPEFPPAPYSAFYGDESSFLISSRTFKGRPWVQHGRVSFAYDPVTKKVAFTQTISRTPTRGFTYIYDPARRDFVDVFPQPFIPGWAVSGLNVSTPHGVYNYLTKGDHRSKQVGLFKLDVEKRRWANLSGGKTTAPARERNRVVYDAKRDRLILVTGKRTDRRSETPQMWAWDLKAGARDWLKLEMTGEVPPHFYRETVYIPKYDCLLSSPRTGKGQKGMIYQCNLSEGNKWIKTGVELAGGVGPGTGLVYDARLDVLVLAYNGTSGPCRLFIMRYVPKKK